MLWALGLFLVLSFALRVWYGSTGLHAGRVWDERFEVANVAALLDGPLLDGDRPWPDNVFYPSLSYLPHTAVLGTAQGVFGIDVLRADGGFTPAGYLLARATEALFGTLSLLWLFRIGRRLFDPQVALAGVALLAAVPWHLRMSAVFKPDALMSLLLLVALEAALGIVERPTARRHLWAGSAVGLAVAAKYNALAAAVPVAVGSLLELRRRPRRLLLLIPLAALAALAVFYLLNPALLTTPELLSRDFGRTLEDYEHKGEAAELGRLRLPLAVVASLASGRFHGAVVAAAALVGLAILAWRASTADDPTERQSLAVFLALPAGYLLLYLLVTTNPAEHNWLPLAPFTSLAAAWLLAGFWRRASGLVPRRRWRCLLDRAALALLLTGSLGYGAACTYAITVPSTWVRATERVRSALGRDFRDRSVLYELPADARPVIRLGQVNKAAMVPLGDVPPAVARRLADGADARIHLAAKAPLPGCLPGGHQPRVQRITARPFTAWGPDVVLYLQPWRRAGRAQLEAMSTGDYRPLAGADVRVPSGAWLSVRVVSAPWARPLGLERARVAGRPARLLWSGLLPRGRHQFVSERVPAPSSGPWTVRLPDVAPEVVGEAELLVWLPPRGGAPCAARAGMEREGE